MEGAQERLRKVSDPVLLDRLGHGGRVELLDRTVSARQFEVVRLLVEHGVDINGMVPGTGHDRAALHNAAGWGGLETVKFLLSIGADPQYFSAMMRRSGPEASQLNLPAYSPEQQVPLNKPQITIGRRRQSTGESPDIDLARPPEDPGVSHQHAILVQQPDGSWAVVDQDSTNGTTVNGADDPIQPFVPVSLKEGDRIHIGAWTTLTIYRA